jgi:hypothetical protein
VSELSLKTADEKRGFKPGASIEVDAAWELDAPPDAIELRVVWYTLGFGTEDFQVVDTVRFEGPSENGRKRVPLTLPRAPYSFFGQIIELEWALELVALPSEDSTRLEIAISPLERPVHLSSVEDPNDGKGHRSRVGRFLRKLMDF